MYTVTNRIKVKKAWQKDGTTLHATWSIINV